MTKHAEFFVFTHSNLYIPFAFQTYAIIIRSLCFPRSKIPLDFFKDGILTLSKRYVVIFLHVAIISSLLLVLFKQQKPSECIMRGIHGRNKT